MLVVDSVNVLDNKTVKDIVVDDLDSAKGKHLSDFKEQFLIDYADDCDDDSAEELLKKYASEKPYGADGDCGAMELVVKTYGFDEGINFASAGNILSVAMEIMFDDVIDKLLDKAGLNDYDLMLTSKNIKALKNASKYIFTSDPKRIGAGKTAHDAYDGIFDDYNIDSIVQDYIDDNNMQTIGDVECGIEDESDPFIDNSVEVALNQYGLFNAMETIKEHDGDFDMLNDSIVDVGNHLYHILLENKLADYINYAARENMMLELDDDKSVKYLRDNDYALA